MRLVEQLCASPVRYTKGEGRQQSLVLAGQELAFKHDTRQSSDASQLQSHTALKMSGLQVVSTTGVRGLPVPQVNGVSGWAQWLHWQIRPRVRGTCP